MRGTRSRGQGATEYVLAVFFIAIACILAVNLFGDRVRTLFGESTEVLSGKGKGPLSTPGGAGTRDSQSAPSTPGGGTAFENSKAPQN